MKISFKNDFHLETLGSDRTDSYFQGNPKYDKASDMALTRIDLSVRGNERYRSTKCFVYLYLKIFLA